MPWINTKTMATIRYRRYQAQKLPSISQPSFNHLKEKIYRNPDYNPFIGMFPDSKALLYRWLVIVGLALAVLAYYFIHPSNGVVIFALLFIPMYFFMPSTIFTTFSCLMCIYKTRRRTTQALHLLKTSRTYDVFILHYSMID